MRKTHVDFAEFVSSESSDDYLPSTGLHNANLLISMAQGETGE
jgi:hypothetical protein